MSDPALRPGERRELSADRRIRGAVASGERVRDLLRRLNLATKAAGIAIWDWDLGADRFTADSFIARAFGSTLLDIPSGAREFLLSTVHDDDRANFQETIERALAQASSVSLRYRSVILGEVHHLQLHGHVDRDAGWHLPDGPKPTDGSLGLL